MQTESCLTSVYSKKVFLYFYFFEKFQVLQTTFYFVVFQTLVYNTTRLGMKNTAFVRKHRQDHVIEAIADSSEV